jgi:hypothetical protein
MLRKSLVLAGAVAAALVWSAAAQAVPGVATGSVHMRTGPGTSYPVVLTVPNGARVDIGKCTSWCAVSYSGRQGYVFGRYVKPTLAETDVPDVRHAPGGTIYYYSYGGFYNEEPFFYGGYPFNKEPFIRDFSYDRDLRRRRYRRHH